MNSLASKLISGGAIKVALGSRFHRGRKFLSPRVKIQGKKWNFEKWSGSSETWKKHVLGEKNILTPKIFKLPWHVLLNWNMANSHPEVAHACPLCPQEVLAPCRHNWRVKVVPKFFGPKFQTPLTFEPLPSQPGGSNPMSGHTGCMFLQKSDFPTPRVWHEIDLQKWFTHDVIPEVGVVGSTSGQVKNVRTSELHVQLKSQVPSWSASRSKTRRKVSKSAS